MTSPESLQQQIAKLGELRNALAQAVVGQQAVVEQLLIGLLAGGHCLLEGAPGLGKTLLVRSLGQALELQFRRVQFTPDLMPSDILGTELLEEDHGTGHRRFRFQPGPIFTNLLLADELNRTPPKTQAALLEAMQERTVSYAGTTYSLPSPFFVLATQNPIEQAGTYPLPEAQLDRFLLHVRVDYPERNRRARHPPPHHRQPQRGGAEGDGRRERGRAAAARARSARGRGRAALDQSPGACQPARARGTRSGTAMGEVGCRTRAGQSLVLASKARALLRRPLCRHPRGCRRPGRAGDAPSHLVVVRRRSRAEADRRCDPGPAGSGAVRHLSATCTAPARP